MDRCVFFLSRVCYVFARACLYVPCGDLLVCGSNCEFVTFPFVSWVRCGTWLYRFLIFATLLTFIVFSNTWFFKGIIVDKGLNCVRFRCFLIICVIWHTFRVPWFGLLSVIITFSGHANYVFNWFSIDFQIHVLPKPFTNVPWIGFLSTSNIFSKNRQWVWPGNTCITITNCRQLYLKGYTLEAKNAPRPETRVCIFSGPD